MEEYVVTLIWGIIVFILVFLVNYFIVFKLGYKNINNGKKKKKTKGLKDFIGFSYVVPRFDLDIEKMNLTYMFIVISLINAFIIAFVFMVVYIIPWDVGAKMLLGFVLIFGLIYSLYELFGRALVKKGYQKERKKK